MTNNSEYDNCVECHYNRKSRKVPIVVGGLYLVEPLNPLKKKYRGEKVILIEADFMENPRCLRVESEWHVKRKSYTEIDTCDLKFVTEELPEDLAKLLEE